MNLTYQVVKSEIDKLNKTLCADLRIEKDEGKKFALLMLRKLSGYKGDKLKRFYCEGSGDHQIDGIYLNEGSEDLEINIVTCKLNSKNGPIQDKDITDLLNIGIPYVIFGEEKVGDINAKLRDIKEELDDIRKQYEEKVIINLILISTSDEIVSLNGDNALVKFQHELQSKDIDFNFEKINGAKISALFSSRTVLKTPMPVKLSGKSFYSLSGREGFVCRLPAQEIINIYHGFKDESGKEYPGYGESLFADNVRKNLGLKQKINKKIYETATTKDDATDFEYFNNGLTILYDEKTGNLGKDSPLLFIKGLQVVNGCQTISAMIKAYEDSKLCSDIYVTCRFIKRTEDQDFIQSVITYTNSQNAISDRDLHSNDQVQYDIQTILDNIGLYYERKLNEFADKDDSKRIDAMDAAQAYLCCELQEPQHAKQSKRKLFNEWYHRIFDSSKSDLAYKLFLSYQILQYVVSKQAENQAKKREKTKKEGKRPYYSLQDLVIAHGSYHIAAVLFEKYFKHLESAQLKENTAKFKFPKAIEIDYKSAILGLTKKITDEKIKRENLPGYFKNTGI